MGQLQKQAALPLGCQVRFACGRSLAWYWAWLSQGRTMECLAGHCGHEKPWGMAGCAEWQRVICLWLDKEGGGFPVTAPLGACLGRGRGGSLLGSRWEVCTARGRDVGYVQLLLQTVCAIHFFSPFLIVIDLLPPLTTQHLLVVPILAHLLTHLIMVMRSAFPSHEWKPTKTGIRFFKSWWLALAGGAGWHFKECQFLSAFCYKAEINLVQKAA